MARSIAHINNYIQGQLKVKNISEVSLRLAAEWLNEAKFLKDSSTSPGFPLRRLVVANKIFGAYKKNNYYWFIRRLNNYRELLSPSELCELLGFTNLNSLYRKIKLESVPHFRLHNGQILFYRDEIIPWLISRQYIDKLGNVVRAHH